LRKHSKLIICERVLTYVLDISFQFRVIHIYAIGPRAYSPLVAAPVPRIFTLPPLE
jgi:hypothetical protein